MPVQRFRVHRLHEHQVDVFRIPCGRRQMCLVQDRAAAHGQMLAQDGVGEDGGHATGQPQILLDLAALGPWRVALPGRQVGVSPDIGN